MSTLQALLIFAGGFLAGVINAMAGGGSLLTVPLLSVAGLEGNLANGTNRVAVLVQNGSSAWGYARRGIGDRRRTLPVLAPTAIGALVGSLAISQVDDRLFERLFGVLMVPLLILSLWPRSGSGGGSGDPAADADGTDDAGVPDDPGDPAGRSAGLSLGGYVVFFGLGLYGGAVQAGIGLLLLLVLSRSGFDLVSANGVKTLVILAITIIAVPVFIVNGQVRWLEALVLSVGTGLGGYAGANVAVSGGERVIKPVLVVVVLVLAGEMIGFWDLSSISFSDSGA